MESSFVPLSNAWARVRVACVVFLAWRHWAIDTPGLLEGMRQENRVDGAVGAEDFTAGERRRMGQRLLCGDERNP